MNSVSDPQNADGFRIAIHQPNFNPYLGVIAKYLIADHVVHLDTVQFVKNEFQNRNKIIVGGNPHWLTIPVHQSSQQLIREVRIDNRSPWRKKHLRTLEQAYAKAPRKAEAMEWLTRVYAYESDSLSDWNLNFLRELFEYLGLSTPVSVASSLGPTSSNPDDRLIELCQQLEGDRYLAGSGGLGYMNRQKWEECELPIEFLLYDHPVYDQGEGLFLPYCGVLDVLFRFHPDQVREVALSGVKLMSWDG